MAKGINYDQDKYSCKSFWLENCGESLTPRQQLNESKTVDIAIMGAGFTGLWTAYYLHLLNRSLKIVVIEKDIAGYGASGRNGGWCSPRFSVSPAVSIERYGRDLTKNLYSAMFNSVTEIEKIHQKENIDVDWQNSGSLTLAFGNHQLPTLEETINTYKELGLDSHVQLLSKDQTDERVRVNGVSGSLITHNSAVLNPGKLVRGLARVLESKDIKIYENTEVLDFENGDKLNSPKLITEHGTITAKHSIVLTGDAGISRFSKVRRKVIPMYSLITLTEPLTDEQWSKIGWEQRETIGSTRLSVDYLQRTRDGRILFGGRGRPYPYASKMKNSFDVHQPSIRRIRERFKAWFPSVKNINFTHSWGGPIGVTRNWEPNISYNHESRVAHAWGFAGQGVSTTNLAGRILTDLISQRRSPLVDLPMVNQNIRKWEVEPLRWFGARYVQSGFEKIDKLNEQKGILPNGKSLAERLGRH